ncbi:HSP90 family heat shock protein, partial [human gut metagenome]
PLTGWLAKRVGEVKLFLWSTIAFAIASWGGGVSTAQAIIKTHHLALRAVALTDTTVLDLCARVLPYETTDGLLTLAEARGESELLYTSTTEAFRRV